MFSLEIFLNILGYSIISLIGSLAFFIIFFSVDIIFFTRFLEPAIGIPTILNKKILKNLKRFRGANLLEIFFNNVFSLCSLTIFTYFWALIFFKTLFITLGINTWVEENSIKLLAITFGLGLGCSLRIISVRYSPTKSRSLGYTFFIPSAIYAAAYGFFTSYFYYTNNKVAFNQLYMVATPLTPPDYVSILILSVMFYLFTDMFLAQSSSKPSSRILSDFIYDLNLFGPKFIIGRHCLYENLANILFNSEKYYEGIAGSFSFLKKKNYSENFKLALDRLQQGFEAKKGKTAIRYIGPVNNFKKKDRIDPSEKNIEKIFDNRKQDIDKFDDILARVVVGQARIRHREFSEKSDKEEKQFLRYIGTEKEVQIERPVVGLEEECYVAYHFADNPFLGTLQHITFEKIWVESTPIIKEAYKLRQRGMDVSKNGGFWASIFDYINISKEIDPTTGISDEQFFKLVENYPGCMTQDYSNQDISKEEVSNIILTLEKDKDIFYFLKFGKKTVKWENSYDAVGKVDTLYFSYNDSNYLIVFPKGYRG